MGSKAEEGRSSMVQRATMKDAAEILALQKLAYRSEAEIVGDWEIPPLRQTLEEILAEFGEQVFLKIEREGQIVGSLRAYLEEGTCYIGKLIVHPDHQDQGLGTLLLGAAEELFPTAVRYELFTGEKSAKNLCLYGKHGYREFQRRMVSEKLILVYLEKRS